VEIDRLITDIEMKQNIETGSIYILPIIETARGLLNASEIISANRVIGLAFGALDFSREMGVTLSKESSVVNLPRAMIPIIARASGAVAIDTPWFDVNDQEGLIMDTIKARDLGYHGKLLIHPNQIESVNNSFLPTEAEINFSSRVVDAFEEAEKTGVGAISLDGKMIDAANYRQAKDLINLTLKIADKENRQV
jgi:citrate lyase subunit beta/citryl-CoA lyase